MSTRYLRSILWPRSKFWVFSSIRPGRSMMTQRLSISSQRHTNCIRRNCISRLPILWMRISSARSSIISLILLPKLQSLKLPHDDLRISYWFFFWAFFYISWNKEIFWDLLPICLSCWRHCLRTQLWVRNLESRGTLLQQGETTRKWRQVGTATHEKHWKPDQKELMNYMTLYFESYCINFIHLKEYKKYDRKKSD